MPATASCTVCDSPDRERIDASLKAGTSLRQLEKSFGIGRTALTGHAGRHTTALETRKYRTAAKGGRKRASKAAAVELKPIENPEDVIDSLQWLRVEAFGLFEQAKARADWKSAERIFGQCVAVIDRFGEMHKVLGGKGAGLTVNIDRSQRVFAKLDAMSTEDLLALRASLDAGNAQPLALVAATAIETIEMEQP